MERKITLRPATEEDLVGILGVERQAPEAAAWSEADYRSLLPAEGTLCLVAEESSREGVVGFLLARTVADEMEVLNLAVAPAYHRRAIARRLLREALTRGQARGARQCWLELRASNLGALAFYRALGFAEARRRRHYYRNPAEDAVTCVCRLAAAGVAP